jgi:hypothetical protein
MDREDGGKGALFREKARSLGGFPVRSFATGGDISVKA